MSGQDEHTMTTYIEQHAAVLGVTAGYFGSRVDMVVNFIINGSV